LPLGYDRQAGRVIYDNKEFLRNSVSYLLDETAAISVRSRTIELRPLNAETIRRERLGWQVGASLVPIALVSLIGWVFVARRKRKFGTALSSSFE